MLPLELRFLWLSLTFTKQKVKVCSPWTPCLYKTSHIKSFVHGHPPASRKYFPNLPENKKNKIKNNKKHSPLTNNFYFLVLDCLEYWLTLMIVSIFVLESSQVGTFKIIYPKHN